MGFDIAGRVKGEPSLSDISVVLIGALYRTNRFRRAPSQYYGADHYIEEEVSDSVLETILGGLVSQPSDTRVDTMEAGTPPASSDPSSTLEDTIGVAAPAGTSPAPMGPSSTREDSRAVPDDMREESARLARIILSDIVLYNPDKAREGIMDGRFFEIGLK